MSSTPLVAWSFALPSAIATRPSAMIGLCQWFAAGREATRPHARSSERRRAGHRYRRRRAGCRRATGDVPPVLFDQTGCRRPPLKSSPSVPALVETKTHLPFQTAGSENTSVGPGAGSDCSSPPGARVHARQPVQLQQAQDPVLPALDRVAAGQQRGARRAEVEVAGVQLHVVRGRPVAEQLRRIGREHEHAVAPVRAAVPRRVAGRDDEVAVRRIDGGAVSRPDRRVARRSTCSGRSARAVGAERVPDVRDPAGGFRTSSRRDPGTAGRRRCSRRSSRSRGRARRSATT